MITRHTLTFLVLLGTAGMSTACDCSIELPGTFCETMDPQWLEPDIVVLGVKIDEVYYGMHVRVLQVFEGAVSAGDTITVWGDNGALCRWYVGAWANGDTAVWGFNNTDFLGNEITSGFPSDLEQPGDYHISYCGTYWLPYANGVVSGGIAPGVSSAPIEEFWPAVTACLGTAIHENTTPEGLRVQVGSGGPIISLVSPGVVRLQVADAAGRAVLTRSWDGLPLVLDPAAGGVYIIQVDGPQGPIRRKVAIP